MIDIETNALLFGAPRIPYHYLPRDANQAGSFCIFTADFLVHTKSGVMLDELPLFRPGGYPLFQLTDKQADELAYLFRKMANELASTYAYKYDLLRNYVLGFITARNYSPPRRCTPPTRLRRGCRRCLSNYWSGSFRLSRRTRS